jgi:hypothetical protein
MSANTETTKLAAVIAKIAPEFPEIFMTGRQAEQIQAGGIAFVVGGQGEMTRVAGVVVDERDANEWLRWFEKGLI